MSAGVAPPLQDTTTRPLATGFVPSGVRTRPSTLTRTPAVREQLGVAVVDRPRVAGAGDPGDDRPGHGEPDEPRVEDLVMAALGGGDRSRSRGRAPASKARAMAKRSERAIGAPPRDAMELPSLPRVDTSARPGRFPVRRTRARSLIRRSRTARPQEDRPTVTALDYGRFEALTFDCYGTLIDWEAGILAGLRPVLARAAGSRPPTTSCSRTSPSCEAAAESRPVPRATARSSAAACARSPPTTAFAPDVARGRRRSPIRSATGRPSRIRPRRSAPAPRTLPARRHHQLR